MITRNWHTYTLFDVNINSSVQNRPAHNSECMPYASVSLTPSSIPLTRSRTNSSNTKSWLSSSVVSLCEFQRTSESTVVIILNLRIKGNEIVVDDIMYRSDFCSCCRENDYFDRSCCVNNLPADASTSNPLFSAALADAPVSGVLPSSEEEEGSGRGGRVTICEMTLSLGWEWVSVNGSFRVMSLEKRNGN